MTNTYFSDREGGLRPRTTLEVPASAWGGIVALVASLVDNGAFAADYPEVCPDGRGPTGTDRQAMGLALRAEIPAVQWPLTDHVVPSTLPILDLLEFCHRAVAEPIPGSFHSFFGHTHLGFDRERGQQDFRGRINRILARNQLAYELGEGGIVRRLAAPVLAEALAAGVFDTGDVELDALLEAARRKFLSPDPEVRRESLEKLWDAWERLKTLEPAADKKASTNALLDKAADEPALRQVLAEEATSLTKVGNTFRIRHAEINQIPLDREDQVEYLFHRLFALIWLALRAR